LAVYTSMPVPLLILYLLLVSQPQHTSTHSTCCLMMS
jgi:hypothetical protein